MRAQKKETLLLYCTVLYTENSEEGNPVTLLYCTLRAQKKETLILYCTVQSVDKCRPIRAGMQTCLHACILLFL
jgi:hypothetical protein